MIDISKNIEEQLGRDWLYEGEAVIVKDSDSYYFKIGDGTRSISELPSQRFITDSDKSSIDAIKERVVYEKSPEGIYCNGKVVPDSQNSTSWISKGTRYRLYIRTPYCMGVTEFSIDRQTEAADNNSQNVKSLGGYPLNHIGGAWLTAYDSTSYGAANMRWYSMWFRFIVSGDNVTCQVLDCGWIGFDTDDSLTMSSSQYLLDAAGKSSTSGNRWNQRHNKGYSIYKIVEITDHPSSSQTGYVSGNSIIERNKDIEIAVNSGAKYGFSKEGKHNTEKRFSMLVGTDVHSNTTRLQSMISYLNYMKCFDCGIHLGDMQSVNFSQSDGTWYSNIIKNSTVPFLTVIGNHDHGNTKNGSQAGTKQQVFNKFISPNLPIAGLSGVTTNYYYKDFVSDFHKIRLIILDMFDTPDTKDSSGNFVVNKGKEYLSQTQINWLISTLNSTPSTHTVVICGHQAPYGSTQDTNIKFNVTNPDYYNQGQEQGYILSDIVNAWINGTSLNQSYSCTTSGLSAVSVSANFTSRGTGKFACYVTGHSHLDIVGHISKYTSQKVLDFATMTNDDYQGFANPMVRTENTKAEDLLTAVSIDTSTRKIYVVRIGANMDWNFNKRENIVISY